MENTVQHRTLGILGGMGPEATALLFRLIIEQTPAQRDADHIPLLIYNLPQIPDRTAAIFGNGPSPVPLVRQGLEVLAASPACCALIPCNTVFHFYDKFKSATRLPVVHLIHTAVKGLRQEFPAAKRVGILATNGTRRTGLYERFLQQAEFEPVYPDEKDQRAVMEEIYAIKAGRIGSEATRKAAERLLNEGADVVLLGCTELSVIYSQIGLSGRIFDALRALARAGVDIGLGRAEPEEYCI